MVGGTSNSGRRGKRVKLSLVMAMMRKVSRTMKR